MFRLLPHGFRNADLRALLAPLLGLAPADMTPGRMSNDLRRLRLHALIERIPGTHRYTVADHGFKIAIFLTGTHQRLVRPGLTEALDTPSTGLIRRLRRPILEGSRALAYGSEPESRPDDRLPGFALVWALTLAGQS